jgi:VanZ family protein
VSSFGGGLRWFFLGLHRIGSPKPLRSVGRNAPARWQRKAVEISGFQLGFRLRFATLRAVANSQQSPIRRWAYAAVIAGLIVIASSRSAVGGPKVEHSDKIVHFSVYGLLGTLVVRAWGRRRAVWAVVAVSAFGASDEVHQAFTPGRSMEFADWVADTLGAVVAVCGYTRWTWYRERLEASVAGRKPAAAVGT